jgi:O-antigen ligase
MPAVAVQQGFDRARLVLLADWLAAAVAASLPWSTSATGILIALWLVAVLAVLDVAALRRELATAAGGLPVLLWAFAACGMLWADGSWSDRLGGLSGFHKLLVVPFLLMQFRRSEHGLWALYGFFASEVALLLLSWALVLIPGLPWRGVFPGVPVKDYILQSECFLICAFALLGIALQDGGEKNARAVLGLVALALFFLADIFFIASARTVFLVAPVLLLLLGWRQFGWKGLLGAGLLGCIVGAAVWFSSPYLRWWIETSISELQSYRASDTMSSTAMHLDFLRESWSFVATAPIVGHGTGSIAQQFRKSAVGQAGAASVATGNPHNQILAVAIQLGVAGAALVLAMWVAHFMLFRSASLIAWIGTVVVVQNAVGSLVNSHLFDFTQGWLYVFGVGVAGGMVLRERTDGPVAATRPVTKP